MTDTRLRDVIYYDEPEDQGTRDDFLLWLGNQLAYQRLVLHWNIAKAKKKDVWLPDLYYAVGFNWYPDQTFIHPAVDWFIRLVYLPAQCIWNRIRYRLPDRVYGTLWRYGDMEDGGYRYWTPSRLKEKYNRLCWRVCMWPKFKGFLFFGDR